MFRILLRTHILAFLCLFLSAGAFNYRTPRVLFSKASSSTTAAFASKDNLQWTSAVSTATDLNAAMEDALRLASIDVDDISTVNLAIFFVSSIYESAFSFDSLNTNFRKTLSASCTILGCTVGAVVGPLAPTSSLEPSECEARSSFGVILARLGDGVSVESFHLDKGTL